MAEILNPITSFSNNTLATLIALVNAIVGVIGGSIVTANGAANGALTVGNGYVSGILGGSVFAAGSIRGGNVQASANLVVSSNVFVQSSTIYVGNSTVNSSMNSINITIPTGNFSNAVVGYFPQSNIAFANSIIQEIDLVNIAAGAVVVDSYPLATLRTAKYLIQAKDNSANNYQAVEILVTHDGVNPYFTEYALLQPNNQVIGVVFTTNATTMVVTGTTSSTNSTIRMVRTALNS